MRRGREREVGRRREATLQISRAAGLSAAALPARPDRCPHTLCTRRSHHTAAMASQPAPWRALLSRSLAQNANLPYAKYLQLATVRPDGRPACRTVVFRGFLGDSDHLTFVTDRRSHKVAEVAANPAVELCWYFPTSREQYRLSGMLDIVAAGAQDAQLEQARQAAWTAMSEAGRSQFMWPHPRQPRMPMDEALFLVQAPDDAGPAADTFCLGIVRVHEVDHIDLYTNARTLYSSQAADGDDGGGGGEGQAAAAAAAATAGARQWSAVGVNP